MTSLIERPAYFKCTRAARRSRFTKGVVYEVFRYEGDNPIIMTDGPMSAKLPVEGCQFEPHDPWAGYQL